MKHVTVTNKPTNQVFQLMKNTTNLCDRFPSAQIGHGKGFGYKIILLRMFLDECDDDEVVLFTDAHDVYLGGSHEDILAVYWSMNANIVFAAEKNCWPVKALETQYPTHTDKYIKYKYLNSGGFIGRAGSLRKWIDQNFHNVSGATDDQLWYTQLHIRSPVKLDVRCEIFQCLHLALFDIDTETRTNKVTGTKPLVWHSNGALLEFFMKDLCKLPWVPPVRVEIDQQLISPEMNIVCVTNQTSVPTKFFKTCSIGPSETIQDIHEKYPDHWIFMLGPNVKLPENFEYRIYGRVLDTRKMYVLANSMGVLEDAQLYFDKSNKCGLDQFMRAGYVEAL